MVCEIVLLHKDLIITPLQLCKQSHTHALWSVYKTHPPTVHTHAVTHYTKRGSALSPSLLWSHTNLQAIIAVIKKKDTSHRKGGSLSSQRGASSSHMPPLLYLLPQSPSLLFPLGPARCIHTNWISHDSNALLGLSGTNTLINCVGGN